MLDSRTAPGCFSLPRGGARSGVAPCCPHELNVPQGLAKAPRTPTLVPYPSRGLHALAVQDLPVATATTAKRAPRCPAQLPWEARLGRPEPHGACHPAPVHGGTPPPARAVGLTEQGCGHPEGMGDLHTKGRRAPERKREEGKLHFPWAPSAPRVCQLVPGVHTVSLFKKTKPGFLRILTTNNTHTNQPRRSGPLQQEAGTRTTSSPRTLVGCYLILQKSYQWRFFGNCYGFTVQLQDSPAPPEAQTRPGVGPGVQMRLPEGVPLVRKAREG